MTLPLTLNHPMEVGRTKHTSYSKRNIPLTFVFSASCTSYPHGTTPLATADIVSPSNGMKKRKC